MAGVAHRESEVDWRKLTEDLYDLRGHQSKALGKLENGKILWGGVGTGKSRVATAYYHKNEAPKHVYVITTAKKRDSFDWQEEFYRIGIGPATGPVLEPARKGKGRGRRSGRNHNDVEQPSVGQADCSSGECSEPGGDQGACSSSPRSDAPDGRGDDDGPDISGFGRAGAYPWVLTVDSWNNIAKYADVSGAFFVFDEQRLVGSGNWTRKFLRIAKHNNWILLSGTPGDTWMDYIPVFVANNFYKNRTAFIREHVVYNTFTKFPKVDRYIGVNKLHHLRHQLLVEMPYERHTKRRVVEVPLKYDKEALEMVLKKRWHIYENRPLRDIAEMFLVGRKLVNSDPSRLEMVKELWQNHPKLIVFYNFNYELESLRNLKLNWPHSSQGITTSGSTTLSSDSLLRDLSTSRSSTSSNRGSSPSPKLTWNGNESRSKSIVSPKATCQISEWNGHKHEAVPTSDRWLYLVQYTAGAEGWNCIETDSMIMFSRNYSWKVTEQAYGRIDRLNTPFKDLWYYDFMTDSFIDRAIGRSLKAKETFNESKYARLFKG